MPLCFGKAKSNSPKNKGSNQTEETQVLFGKSSSDANVPPKKHERKAEDECLLATSEPPQSKNKPKTSRLFTSKKGKHKLNEVDETESIETEQEHVREASLTTKKSSETKPEKTTLCFKRKLTPEEKESKKLKKREEKAIKEAKKLKDKESKKKSKEEKQKAKEKKKQEKESKRKGQKKPKRQAAAKKPEDQAEQKTKEHVPVAQKSEVILPSENKEAAAAAAGETSASKEGRKNAEKSKAKNKKVKKRKSMPCFRFSKQKKMSTEDPKPEDVTLLSLQMNKEMKPEEPGKLQGKDVGGNVALDKELQIVPDSHQILLTEPKETKGNDPNHSRVLIDSPELTVSHRNVSPGRDSLEYRRKEYFRDFFLISRSMQCDCGDLFHQPGEEKTMSMAAGFESILARLEKVAMRLEGAATVAKLRVEESDSFEMNNQWLLEYDKIINGSLAVYHNLSKNISEEVQKHSDMVVKAFKIQRNFLHLVSCNKEPDNHTMLKLLEPLSECIQQIQSFKENNRTCATYDHLCVISESIAALGWVTMSPTPAPAVKDMMDVAQFFVNRVLKEWKAKDNHVSWVKSWMTVLSELYIFVKTHHTTGLTWNPKGGSVNEHVTAPPPPPLPTSFYSATSPSADTAALFADLNQGEQVTKGLRHVTDDMKAAKSPIPHQTLQHSLNLSKSYVEKHPPVFRLEGKKWIIEHQYGAKALTVSETEMNQCVYIFKCEDSVVQVKGKVGSIVLDSCKKTSLLFDSVVASVELVNCQDSQVQVLGKLPTVTIDKCDGVQLYVNKDALDVEITTSKSSAVNVLTPTKDGEFEEQFIPEQLKTTIRGSTIVTTVSNLNA